MNGRIYDPELGRFLSADPTMQHPYSTQGQNRYAYVQNNPLKYVDMSGFGFFSKLWGGIKRGVKKVLSNPVVAIAVAAVAAYLTAGAAVGWFGGYASVGKAAAAAAVGTAGATTALVAAGAVGGAVFGFIASGGDLKAALTGAITGAAFAYVGSLAQAGSWGTFETALAHGTVGGAGSELGGGSFKDGFVGAFFAAAVNPLIKNSWPIEIKGALRTLAGGTASRLGGGKFANGATSAAMAFLFNEVFHDDGQKEPIDLTEHEGVNGSHTIRDHVGKSDQSLLNQMDESADMFGGAVRLYKGQTGSFSSLESANKLVSSTLSTNQELVTDFLDSGRKTLVLNQSFSSPTGRVAFRNGRGSFFRPGRVHFTGGTGVRVVIRRNESFSSGFNVHTAFPTSRLLIFSPRTTGLGIIQKMITHRGC